MPVIEAPLMYGGPTVDWDAQRAHSSLRCLQCRTVFPGRFMEEVNPETMRCRECEAQWEPATQDF